MMTSDQPSLLSALIAARRLGYKHRGPIAIVPVWIIFIFFIPIGFFHFYIDKSEISISDSMISSFVPAVLVVYGIFSAVTIQAVVQVQQITTVFPFSDFLRERGVFDIYNALPVYVFLIDVFSMSLCVVMMVLTSFLGDYFNIYVIIFSASNVIYCAKITYDLLNVLRGLSFHLQDYQRIKFEVENEESNQIAH